MKVLFKLICFSFILILVVFSLNTIIFSLSQPTKFKNPNWGGKWISSNYSLIGGKILADFPEEIPINEEFEVDLLIYYNIWGFYRVGGIREFTLIASLGEDNSTGGENTLAKDQESQPMATLNFKAKLFDSIGQILEYSGVSNEMKSKISGEYKSIIPMDVGTFKIRKL